MNKIMPYTNCYNNTTPLRPSASSVNSFWPTASATPSSWHPKASTLETRKFEAELCQRFVQISCAKMHASRQSRSGARLYENLLILRLLTKARNNVTMLPYECAGLLRQRQSYEKMKNDHLSQTHFMRTDKTPNDLKKMYNHSKQDDIINQTKSQELHFKTVMERKASNGKEEMNFEKNDDEDYSMEINYINESINEEQQTRLDKNERTEGPTASGAIEVDPKIFVRNQKFTVVTPNSETNKELPVDETPSLKTTILGDFNASTMKTIDIKEKFESENNDKNESRSFSGRLYERVSNAAQFHPEFGNETEKLTDVICSVLKERSDEKKYCSSKKFNTAEIEEEETEIATSMFLSKKSSLDLWNESAVSFSESNLSNSSSPLSSSSTFLSFDMTDEMLSLNKIMNNPVSPPLSSISIELLTGFSGSKTNVYDDYAELNMTEEKEMEEAESNFCKCDNLSSRNAESMAFCRKRKTSGNSKTAICEKRYCCDDDGDLIGSIPYKFESNYCNRCGCRKVEMPDHFQNAEADLIVPDIDVTADKNNVMHSFDEAFDINKRTHNFSAWLIKDPEVQNYQYKQYKQHQLHQQQGYCHHQATTRHKIMNNNKTILDNSNNYMKAHYETDNYQQAWEQIVPVARRNHFVGPIVGLVAETPYILMF